MMGHEGIAQSAQLVHLFCIELCDMYNLDL